MKQISKVHVSGWVKIVYVVHVVHGQPASIALGQGSFVKGAVDRTRGRFKGICAAWKLEGGRDMIEMEMVE